MNKILTALAAGSLIALAPAAPASAQALKVVDPSGAEVGTVVGFSDGMLTVKTDKYEVKLPKTSFTPDGENMLFAMTQAELNAEYEKGLAKIEDSVAVGKQVVDADLQPAGTIEAIAPASVFVRLTNGTVVRVPTDGVTPRATGAVLGYRNADLVPLGVEMTADQVQAALEQANEEAGVTADAGAEADTDAASAGVAAEAAGDAAVAAGEAAEAAGEAAAAAGKAAAAADDHGAH